VNTRLLSIPEKFQQTVALYSDQPLVKMVDGFRTFSDIDNESNSIAVALQKQGITEGDRVALYCINGDAFVASYLGIIKAGAIVVPINLLINAREISYILDDAGINGFIYHQAMSVTVESLSKVLNKMLITACIGDRAVQNDHQLIANWLESEEVPTVVSVDPINDVAAILYTSGTTGFPKGAMLTHNNLVFNTTSAFDALSLTAGEDTLLLVLPMFHAFAATVGMLLPLLHGISFSPVTKFDPVLISDVIEKTGATVFLGVPSLYGAILRLSDDKIAQWKTIRFGVSGGAAMPVALMESFEKRFNFPILEGDGPTECSPVTSVTRFGYERKPASVGVAIPGVEVQIFDDEGLKLKVDKIGEICVKGPNIMKGYWGRKEATAKVFFDDWLRTGDLGYIDEDDYIFMVDRKKDLIIVNGMNVYPRMIEEVLFQHEAIVEAAVVGEPHHAHGETIVAHIVRQDDKKLSEAEVKQWCKSLLGQHQRPRKIMFRDSLPKNATGKVLKRELRLEGEIERGIDNR